MKRNVAPDGGGKKKGWFSARHETRAEHDAAVARYLRTADTRNLREARWLRAQAADAARPKRTPEEQRSELDRRLGQGVGARRERARLDEAIKAAQKVAPQQEGGK